MLLGWSDRLRFGGAIVQRRVAIFRVLAVASIDWPTFLIEYVVEILLVCDTRLSRFGPERIHETGASSVLSHCLAYLGEEFPLTPCGKLHKAIGYHVGSLVWLGRYSRY